MKGPFGTGKTLAACTWALEGPLYLAYIDKKKPVEMVWFKRHRPSLLKNIKWDMYGSYNIHKLVNQMREFKLRGCPYLTIVIDSITTLTSSAVNWSLGFRDIAGPKMDEKNPQALQFIPDFDEYKVETSMVTQLLDICKTLPVNVIWIAHPLPTLKVEGGQGTRMQVTKQTNIVSYGQKVGAIVGGQFTEVYHFGKQVDQRIVWTDMVGDDYAKTSLFLPQSFDITNKLFYEVWKPLVDKSMAGLDALALDKPEGPTKDEIDFLTPQPKEPNAIAEAWQPNWK